MELKLMFNKKEFSDIIKKMAVPVRNQTSNIKKEYLYPIIFPSFIPNWEDDNYINSTLKWISESPDVITWVEVEYTNYSGLKEPIERIPIDVKNILKVLDDFDDKDQITFTYNDNEQIITNGRRTLYMPIIGEEPNEDMIFDAYPGNIDENDIVILKEGTLKTNISGAIDVGFLKFVISRIKKYSLEKEHEIVYNFRVDGDHHLIEGYSNFENLKKGNVFSEIYQDKSIVGSGELHFTNYLADVVGVLSGNIRFYTIDNGPLWIMQETEKMKVRYFIPPLEE